MRFRDIWNPYESYVGVLGFLWVGGLTNRVLCDTTKGCIKNGGFRLIKNGGLSEVSDS